MKNLVMDKLNEMGILQFLARLFSKWVSGLKRWKSSHG